MNTPSAVATFFVLLAGLIGAARMRKPRRALDEVNAYYERLRSLK